MPIEAMEFLNERFPVREKEKFYEEQNEEGRFYEAKFCVEKHLYSVKFKTTGELYDIERKIKFQEAPAIVRLKIEQQLDEQFKRHKIVKAQEKLEQRKVVGYEIEIKGKTEERLGYFEAQFDAKGQQESIRPIEERPNDFLFF